MSEKCALQRPSVTKGRQEARGVIAKTRPLIVFPDKLTHTNHPFDLKRVLFRSLSDPNIPSIRVRANARYVRAQISGATLLPEEL